MLPPVRLTAALLFCCLLPLGAEPGGAAAEFIRRSAQWMNSPETGKRKAAYRTWLQLGPEAMPEYEKALRLSLRHHDQRIGKLCRGSAQPKNPYLDHETVAAELDSERDRVLPLIRTDWKKEPKKVEMLRDEMEALGRLHARTLRAARSDTAAFDAAIDGHFAALFEITRELERFDQEADSAGLDDEELRAELVDEHIEGSHLETVRRRFRGTLEAAGALKEAGEANREAGPWASGAMKAFAETLNAERDLLGLGPLRLEEKLSAAAEGHSEDMARLGFFAHESPVPGKKTPWDRARRAGFSGNASGENIFMGSANPQAAYNGWFASDGHRFIMMATGPNVLGVGIAGNHWTMMTGSLRR